MARKKRKGTIKENRTEGSYKNSNIFILFLVHLFIFNIGRPKRGRKIRNSICKLYSFPFSSSNAIPLFSFCFFFVITVSKSFKKCTIFYTFLHFSSESLESQKSQYSPKVPQNAHLKNCKKILIVKTEHNLVFYLEKTIVKA